MRAEKGVNTPLRYALSVLFWLAVWQLTASAANRGLLLKIPLPTQTLRAFFENCARAEFWSAVGSSVLHIVCGFLSAVVIGVMFALFSAHSSVFRALSAPVMHLVRSVPVAVFIIIAWLWIPTRILPSCISCLMVMPIIMSHTEAALCAIDEKLVEMARVFGMKRVDILLKIKAPLIAPGLRAGCITGLGIAWKSGVAAEVICNPTGSIGALLQGAKTAIDYEQVFAVTLTVVLLSLALENVLKIVWRERKR